MRSTRSDRPDGWFAWTLGAVVLFWLIDLLVLRAGTPDPLDDSWEYGAAARSLIAGLGFRTPVIHPPLWTLRDAAGHVPVLVHGPVLPMLIAPLVALFGPRAIDHVAWVAVLFAVLAALAIQRLGARLLSPVVGAAGALLFTCSPLVIRAVHHDVVLPVGAWLLALTLDQLLRVRPHAGRAGIAMGFGALVRPEFVLAAPILALVAGSGALRFLALTAVVMLPWMWHGWVNAGSPLFNLSSYLLLGYWGAHPGIAVMRDFTLTPRAWPHALEVALPTLPAKWLAFLPHVLKRVLASPTGATGWLVPIGALAAVQAAGSRRFAAVSAGLLLVPIAVMTLTLYDVRYLVPFLPVLALGAARGASEAGEWLPRWGRRSRAWLGALALLVLPSTLPALHDGWRQARAMREQLAAERAALAALAGAHPYAPGSVAFSDTPDFVAWTLRRPTVWVAREEYLALPAEGTDGPRDRPARAANDLAWFHEEEGRGPAIPAVPERVPAAGPADSVSFVSAAEAPAESPHRSPAAARLSRRPGLN